MERPSQSPKNNETIESSLKTIFKGSIVVLAYTSVGYLLSFLFKVMAARYFGPLDYGWFSLATAVVVMGSNIASLGMHQSVARFIPFFIKRGELASLSYTISFGAKSSFIASLVVAFAIFVFAPYISQTLHGDKSFTVFLMLFAAAVPLDVIFSYFLGVLRGFKDMMAMTLSDSVILWLVRIVFLSMILIMGLGVKWILVPYVASYLVGLVVAWTYIKKRSISVSAKIALLSPGDNDSGLWREIVSYSLPLVLSTITTMLRKRFDVIIVGLFLTAFQVGLYNVALPLAMLMTMFLFAINRIAMPVTSGLFSSDSEEEMEYVYKSIAKWSLMATLPIFLMFFFFPGKIIGTFFGEEYLKAASVLRILSAGFFINSISGSFGEFLQSYGRTKSIFIISTSGTTINLLLMLVLIPAYGIEGAAVALTTSLVCMCLLGNVYIYHYKRMLPFSKEYVNTLLIGGFISAAFYFLEKIFSSDMADYIYVGFIVMSLMIYVVALYLFGTNEFDRKIIWAIRRKWVRVLQGAT